MSDRIAAADPALVGLGLVAVRDFASYTKHDPESITPVERAAAPDAPAIAGNAPNPFNPATTIDYSIATPGPVMLRIYDVGGRLVRTLVDHHIGPLGHVTGDAVFGNPLAEFRPHAAVVALMTSQTTKHSS